MFRAFGASSDCCRDVMLFLALYLLAMADASDFCSKHNKQICDIANGKICLNNKCVSACITKGMVGCDCPKPDDSYCYLCCGNADSVCQPAHLYNILQPNGEYWERNSCRRCRGTVDGLPCDDVDKNRLCFDGKCTNTMCQNKMEGEYCDLAKEKICIDGECLNPCGKKYVCECSERDPSSGLISDDRCQLCCFNYENKKCENAHRTLGITSAKRPIARVGLSCLGGRTCNRYGICASCSIRSNLIAISSLILLVFFYQRLRP